MRSTRESSRGHRRSVRLASSGGRRARAVMLAAVMIGDGLAFGSAAPGGAEEGSPRLQVPGHPDNSWMGRGGVPQPVHDPNGPCVEGCAETEVKVLDVEPSYWESVPGSLGSRRDQGQLARAGPQVPHGADTR